MEYCGPAFSNRKAVDMAMHCHMVLLNRRKELRVRSVYGGIPKVHSRSKLHWFPSLTKVCLFPIEEGREYPSAGPWLMKRPLFFCELDAGGMKVVHQRICRIVKKRRRI